MRIFRTNSWAPGLAPYDLTTSNLQSGMFYPYLRSVGVFLRLQQLIRTEWQ